MSREVYRSRDHRWVVEHNAHGYWIYDRAISDTDEVWSCWRMDQLYAWLAECGVRPSDLVEVDAGYRP